MMRKPKDNDLAGRRIDAANAKAALLQAHLAAKEAAEPTRLAREQERLATAVARDERRAQRIQEVRDEKERVQAEAAEDLAAADAAASAEVEGSEKLQNDRASRVDDEAARKAERDRRYANRKARQR